MLDSVRYRLAPEFGWLELRRLEKMLDLNPDTSPKRRFRWSGRCIRGVDRPAYLNSREREASLNGDFAGGWHANPGLMNALRNLVKSDFVLLDLQFDDGSLIDIVDHYNSCRVLEP